ncbi:ionotropic receptor 21a-like [Scylla paramamosain]|uniref:ionotropic receptor 21a-like n=1 Tax=Scylla paramamosain TaxID=85552 RepID=UPI0030836808
MGRFVVMVGVMVAVCRQSLHAFPQPLSLSADAREMQEMKISWGAATKAVLDESLAPHCSVILLTDSPFIMYSLSQVLRNKWAINLLQVAGNETLAFLPRIVKVARKIRRRAWCVAVLVASAHPSFLLAFARESRAARLLAWETRLLAVTSLTSYKAHDLLRRHWTFSMMNTVLLNLEPIIEKGEVLVHFPYTSNGRAQVVGVARWSSLSGLTHRGDTQRPFSEKFSNFHGAKIPVTALILPPFWKLVDPHAADSWSRYSGRDCLIMKSVARMLNFTFQMFKSSNIDEIMASLEADLVMISGFRIMLIPQVLARIDHSYFIDPASFTFSMAKPTIQPQWQSLYYPLGPWVWLSVLISTIVMSFLMYIISHMDEDMKSRSVVLETVGMLLGQDMWLQMPRWTAARLLVLLWLVLVFVISTGYKGTLIAFLSVPKYPTRPETMEELAKSNVRSLFTQNATRFLTYFQQSNIPAYRSVSSRVDIAITVKEGLQQISEQRKAFFHERYNTMLHIAEYFTNPDGSTRLYVARQNVIPNYAGWMMPHDAPYKQDVDRSLLRVIESGLKEKFTDDMMSQAWQEIRLKQKEYQEIRTQKTEQQEVKNKEEEEEEEDTSNTDQSDDRHKSLSLDHMQGAFWILLVGSILGVGAFLGEMIAGPRRLELATPWAACRADCLLFFSQGT